MKRASSFFLTFAFVSTIAHAQMRQGIFPGKDAPHEEYIDFRFYPESPAGKNFVQYRICDLKANQGIVTYVNYEGLKKEDREGLSEVDIANGIHCELFLGDQYVYLDPSMKEKFKEDDYRHKALFVTEKVIPIVLGFKFFTEMFAALSTILTPALGQISMAGSATAFLGASAYSSAGYELAQAGAEYANHHLADSSWTDLLSPSYQGAAKFDTDLAVFNGESDRYSSGHLFLPPKIDPRQFAQKFREMTMRKSPTLCQKSIQKDDVTLTEVRYIDYYPGVWHKPIQPRCL